MTEKAVEILSRDQESAGNEKPISFKEPAERGKAFYAPRKG
jgi:hypothetical protein